MSDTGRSVARRDVIKRTIAAGAGLALLPAPRIAVPIALTARHPARLLR